MKAFINEKTRISGCVDIIDHVESVYTLTGEDGTELVLRLLNGTEKHVDTKQHKITIYQN